MSEIAQVPAVTVVIANHNYGHWVMDAINSAANDPYPRKLIAVVDDGSTDGSAEVVRSHMLETEGNARTISGLWGRLVEHNIPIVLFALDTAKGPSLARNIALTCRRIWEATDAFAILDADDLFLLGKLEKSMARLYSSPIIGAVYSDYDIINRSTGGRTREFKEPFSRMRLRQECIVHSACTIKKAALEKVGCYDTTLRVAEDYDLWLRLSEHYLISHIPECLMEVGGGEHGSSHTVPNQIWQACWKRVMEKTQQRMSQ